MSERIILYFLVHVCALSALNSSGQNALIAFDPITMAVDTIPTVSYTVTDTIFGTMQHSTGTWPGWVELEQNEPLIPFVGAQNVRPEMAVDVFELAHFPIRTAGALRRLTNAVESHNCSANLVGPQHVLTARHCIRSFSGTWETDTLYFAPVFDQGMTSQFGRSRITRYIVPTVFGLMADFALLELAEPIGVELGWFGLAFSEEQDFYDNKIVHKLSYPADTSIMDSTLIYNGDTLYHQYTPMIRRDAIVGYPSLGVSGIGLGGIVGESGSGALITDNITYQITGVASLATEYLHVLLDAWHFHQFSALLEDFNVSLEERNELPFSALIFPNPMSTLAQVAVSHPNEGPFEITLHDMTGRCSSKTTFSGADHTLDVSGLAPGAYVYNIRDRERHFARGTLVIE